jgi:hypothetical protein
LRLYPSLRGKNPPRYLVDIKGRIHGTTAQIYQSLAIGQTIRAEIGAGSGMILAAETIPWDQ